MPKFIEEYIAKINPRYSEAGKPSPIWQHNLTYDSALETLEPIYYWIFDFTKGAKYNQIKIEDNFAASPGSSYFIDLSQRAQKMQEEGMKILGAVNLVIKSIVNILYDLKEFEIRLNTYKDAMSDDPKKREQGMLALKDIWMSNVDIKRGRGSINQLTYELQFTTLRDAFMKANSVEDVKKMTFLNDRVKRVLIPRIEEFLQWKDRSYEELKRRFEIEKAYLKSQVDTLKLYASWVGPYIKAAERLSMAKSAEMEEPALVSVFGTMTFNLSLMLTKEIDILDEVSNKNLPQNFATLFERKEIRPFYQLLFIDFSFRTYQTQQFPHAGLVSIDFKAYAANEDELNLIKDKIESEKTKSMFKVAQELSEESLEQLSEEINSYLEKPKIEEKEEEYMFSGLIKGLKETFGGKSKREIEEEKKKEEEEKKKEKKERLKMLKEEGIPEDSYAESIVREYAELKASDFCFNIFDKFKKSRGLASFPNPFEEPDVYAAIRQRIAEIRAAIKK